MAGEKKDAKKGMKEKLYGQLVKFNVWLEKKASGGVDGLVQPFKDGLDKVQDDMDKVEKGLETADKVGKAVHKVTEGGGPSVCKAQIPGSMGA